MWLPEHCYAVATVFWLVSVANGVLNVANALLCSCLGGCLAVAMMFWVIARGLLCSR